MAQNPLNATAAIAIPSFVWGGNYLAGAYAGYPFLYCWFSAPLGAFYLQWGKLALYGFLIYLGIKLWRLKLIEALAACLFVVAIIELPRFIGYLFNSGGSCG